MKDCIFCQIINKEIPTQTVFEDERVLVFKDIQPKAKIHFLIVPKEHISSLQEVKDSVLFSQLLQTAKTVAKKFSLDKNGYKIIINVGQGGGQTVFHLHLHLLSGEELKEFII